MDKSSEFTVSKTPFEKQNIAKFFLQAKTTHFLWLYGLKILLWCGV